jgi:hypothetical protein
MAFEQRDNSGSLFVNDRKEKESHPDRQGSAKVVCPHCGKSGEHWLSGWIKDLKNKPGKWLSIAFEAKEDKPATAPEFDDDIPF